MPSTSVIVPVVLPFTKTLAPITDSPCVSITVPEIVLICALNKAMCLFDIRKEIFLLLRNKFRSNSFRSIFVPWIEVFSFRSISDVL